MLIEKNEVVIICVFIICMSAALALDRISESAFVALMGTFVGYTFGRIFNHIQGKE